MKPTARMTLSKALAALGLAITCVGAALAAEPLPPALQKPEWAYSIPVGPQQPAARRDQRLYSLPGHYRG